MASNDDSGAAAFRRSDARRRFLLSCGIGAALVHIATDLVAASRYPEYSFADQAVSELFAIGAPTSSLVVPLFSLSSVLLLAFAWGIGLSARGSRALFWTAILFAASALDALLLWNFFPMHMRGDARTFTDTMHLVLGANPFVFLALCFAAAALSGWFRLYSVATLLILLLPAIFAFRYVSAVDAGLATPGLGLAERFSQYGYQVWQVTLAVLLLRRVGGKTRDAA